MMVHIQEIESDDDLPPPPEEVTKSVGKGTKFIG